MRLPSAAAVPRRLVLGLAPYLLVFPTRPPPATAFVDPGARFALEVPVGFVQSSRKAATTGTIFVAGNFPRFTVLSVTAWPLRDLLNEDAQSQALPGLPASPVPSGSADPAPRDLSELGSAATVARLLMRRRDREASAGAVQSVLLASSLSPDTGALEFEFNTESAPAARRPPSAAHPRPGTPHTRTHSAHPRTLQRPSPTLTSSSARRACANGSGARRRSPTSLGSPRPTAAVPSPPSSPRGGRRWSKTGRRT